MTPEKILHALWTDHQLDSDALNRVTLTGAEPVFPSSFAVGTAAQVSIASAALMASEIGHQRGLAQQTIAVDMLEAAIECTGLFTLDGETPPDFAELSGLYQCKDGWLRLHANFDHHRDAGLKALGLPCDPEIPRDRAQSEALKWNTTELETAVLDNGGACAVVRTFEQWDALPQAHTVAKLPLVEISKIGDAAPKTLPGLNKGEPPLSGVRMLDLTRILAGPVCGRTLAAYGAEVMLINSPELPNIEHIAETSRGKLSAHINLEDSKDKHTLQHLISESRVFIQGYRPGSIAARGFDPIELAVKQPGIIYTSLSAYGQEGPWQSRRGFDSLLQSASGINMAEAQAKGTETPTALPMQILDYASGFLMAFGTQAALYKQITEGGSWHVQVSLARTGHWLRSFGQNKEWLQCIEPDAKQYLQSYPSSYGELRALPHPAVFSTSKVEWKYASAPPGSSRPVWPDISEH